jgi:hypothetical protein
MQPGGAVSTDKIIGVDATPCKLFAVTCSPEPTRAAGHGAITAWPAWELAQIVCT